MCVFFFFSSRRRHTRLQGDWSSDVCSSDLRYGEPPQLVAAGEAEAEHRVRWRRPGGGSDRAAIPDEGPHRVQCVECIANRDGTTEGRNDRVAGRADRWEGRARVAHGRRADDEGAARVTLEKVSERAGIPAQDDATRVP